ncbi:MAG: ABC transporter permease [Gemmatimonadales bacterium]
MSVFRSDLRSAARSLRRSPAFTLSAVLCLMLGIGVTAAIASAVDRALLQPLPFKDPDRLVTVYRVAPHPNANTWPLSAPNYKDLAAGTRQLESMAAIASGSALVTLRDEAVQVSRLRVTGNFFPLLGVHALAGRLLAPADDDAGQNRVVVVSEELWRKYLGGDPNVVSQTIQIDGQAATVIGIIPRGFRVPHGSSVIHADIWEPMRFTTSELGSRGSNYLQSIGRLAPGATVESARQELAHLYDGLGKVFADQSDDTARAVALQADGVSSVRTPLLLLFGAVVMVLLIAATNVASLLLARGVQRQREMAVRTAIGASRWDVMRPVLAESLLVAATGAALGLGLALVGVRTIGRLAAARMPQLAGLTVDMRIIVFALVLSVLVAVLCGAIPAWRATQVDPQDAMRSGRGGGSGRGHNRALNLLVVVEVALSLVLLIGAGLMLKGFTKLLESSPGFDPAPMLTMDVRISPKAYADGATARQFLDPALEAIRRDPSIEAAGAITLLPYDNWGNNFGIRYEGQSADNAAKRPIVESRVVTPGFFDVTRQRLLGGRMLRASDEGAPHAADVVLVNEALVKRDFPGQDPLGKRFYTGDTTFATIVGVVSDIKNSGPVRPPAPEIYETYRQGGSDASGYEFVVRVKGDDPLAASKSVQAAIRSVDKGAAVSRIRSMSGVISDSVGQPRFLFSLMGVFAVVALVLAVAGLYGVMSYVVAQRTRELGIRAALGSTAARTVRLVARHGAVLVSAGIALGFVASSAVTGFMRSMLYGVSPLDATTWAIAAAAIVLAGLAAVLIPSLRATRVDPMTAIRME